MTALNATSLTRVLEELRAQNWTLSASPDGLRWRAEPPDPKRKQVTFSARPTDLTLVIRSLRAEGFRWPPPGLEQATPAAVVRAVPFPAKPHPDVTVERIGLAAVAPDEPPRLPLALVKPPQPPRTADEAFEKLKETRDYAELAGVEKRDAEIVFELAESALRRASETYEEALKQMAEAKREFDDLFNRPGKT